MQSCASVEKKFTADLIFNLASVADPKEVRTTLESALKGNLEEARSLLLQTMLKYSLSGLDIIKAIQKEIWNITIDNRSKVALIDKCGEIEFRMVEGADEYVQLEAFLAHVVLAGSKK